MISEFQYCNPVKVVFGTGTLNQLGEEIKAYGKKAIIVSTGSFFKESGLMTRIQKILEISGIDSVLYYDVDPNPLNTQVDAAAKVCRDQSCDMVIGLGGGSAIDAAKGVAMAAGHNLPVWSFAMGCHDGAIEVTEKNLPIIAITTTSGTGSHVTPFSVISNMETKQKPGIASVYNYAKVAIVDPELMLTMPAKVTASTGFDVLAHSLEAYTCINSNSMTDIYSEEALRLVGMHIITAVNEGSNIEARTALAWADTLAGYAIAASSTTLCHSIAHAIGGVAKTVHGETLAAMTPSTVRFSMNASPEKYKKIGLLLKGELDMSKGNLEDTIKTIEEIIEAIGLKRTLSELGVKKEQFEAIAKGTVEYMGGCTEVDPRVATTEDVIAILKDSF